jgi:hypothetical protein
MKGVFEAVGMGQIAPEHAPHDPLYGFIEERGGGGTGEVVRTAADYATILARNSDSRLQSDLLDGSANFAGQGHIVVENIERAVDQCRNPRITDGVKYACAITPHPHEVART